MTSGSIPTPDTSTSRVVPLWHWQDGPTGAMLARVQHQWAALRHGTAPPARADLRPEALGPALPCAFLIDRARPGKLRFRLAGQHLSRLMGLDVRGMPLRAFFELGDRSALMEKAEQVFEQPAMLRLQLVSDAQGCTVLDGQMLLLPLRGRSGRVDRALGVLATDGPLGLPPRRFRIRRAALSALDPCRDPTPGSPAGAAPRRGRGRVLTVIKGGKV